MPTYGRCPLCEEMTLISGMVLRNQETGSLSYIMCFGKCRKFIETKERKEKK